MVAVPLEPVRAVAVVVARRRCVSILRGSLRRGLTAAVATARRSRRGGFAGRLVVLAASATLRLVAAVAASALRVLTAACAARVVAVLLAPIQPFDQIRDHFRRLALLPLFIHILADLQFAFHENEATFVEVVRHILGVLPPCRDVNKVGLLLLAALFRFRRDRAIHGKPKLRDRDSARRDFEFRVGDHATDKGDAVVIHRNVLSG